MGPDSVTVYALAGCHPASSHRLVQVPNSSPSECVSVGEERLHPEQLTGVSCRHGVWESQVRWKRWPPALVHGRLGILIPVEAPLTFSM